MQLLLQTLTHLLRISRLRLSHIRHPVTHQVVHDPRQLVRTCRYRLGRTQTRTLTTQIGTQVTLAPQQAPRRQSKACAARFLPRRVRLAFILPLVCCQWGHKPWSSPVRYHLLRPRPNCFQALAQLFEHLLLHRQVICRRRPRGDDQGALVGGPFLYVHLR
jgi:hypothetical protein